MRTPFVIIGATALAALGLLGCRGETTRDPPIVPIRNMYNQPRYDMQRESAFFVDHRTMRPNIEGTVSREMEVDTATATGRNDDDTAYVLTVPQAVVDRAGSTAALVARGEERYNIFCAPCHDRTGRGDGMAVKRGMLKPPNLHIDRIRHMPDGQLFATISNGIRNMPAYGPQVPVHDRWAIASYVRALQVSQAPLVEAERIP